MGREPRSAKGADGVRVLLAGDVTSTGRTGAFLGEDRKAEIWNDTKVIVEAHDYALCNLECPLGERGQPIRKVGPHLRGSARLAGLLKEWGFDAVSLANNHIMDYGPEALRDTIELCRNSGLAAFGAGENVHDAEAAHRVRIRGLRVSFLAAAEEEFCIAEPDRAGAAPLRATQLYHRIRRERAVADWVIVIFHGGNEYYPLPRPGLQELCRFFVAAGADAVIGHHPHVPGGYEIYEEAPIVYSLGNFLFDRPGARPEGWETGLLCSIELRQGVPPVLQTFPSLQWDALGTGVRLADPASTRRARAGMDELRAVIEDPEQLRAEWRAYCEREGSKAVVPFFAMWKGQIYTRMMRFFFRLGVLPTDFWTENVLNRVRCESHREHFTGWAEGQMKSDSEREDE